MTDHIEWGLTDDERKAMRMLDAARDGRPNLVQKQIERGALPDLRVPREKLPSWMDAPKVEGTFLHWAAGTVSDGKSMLRMGIASQDPNAARADGHTPLSLAAIAGSDRAVTCLTMAGADVDRRINGEEMSIAVARAGGFKGAKMLRAERDNLRIFRDLGMEDRDEGAREVREKKAAQTEGQWREATSSKVVTLGDAQRARLEQKRAAVGDSSREEAVHRIARLKAKQAEMRAEDKLKKRAKGPLSRGGNER